MLTNNHMQVRNSTIGKLVVGSDRYENLPNLGQLSFYGQSHSTAKAGVGLREVPEIVSQKKVVLSPPQTDFKVQDYPLKRIQKGLSGWDWQTEISDEYNLTDKVHNCKPKYSTFSKLFPNRNSNLYPLSKPEHNLAKSPTPNKEFNIRLDRMSEYREAMIKAHQLFKSNK